jgi:signal transduction histidine kinase
MKVQFIIVLILIGILPMLIFSRMIIDTYKKHAVEQRIKEIQGMSNVMSNLLISSGYLANKEAVESTEVDLKINQIADVYAGRIIVVDSGLYIIKDTYGLEEGKILVSEEVIKGLQGSSNQGLVEGNQYGELTIPITDSDSKEITGVILFNFSLRNIGLIYSILEQKAIILLIVIGMIVIIIGFIYSNVLIRPFKSLVSSIDHISEGYMNERISIKGFLEIEGVANSFNHMISRMEKLEDSRQEFVSNVSHELKTPITSIKVLSDSLLSQDDVPVEIYREFLLDITEEIERENKIINDLLSLVKMDKTVGDLNITSISINDLLGVILKRLRPIAEERHIELLFESFRTVVAEVDEVKLSLAINNLIENAIKYNIDDGWVRASLNADHKFFYIKVSDSGVGIPEDEQENVFDRFYRVDKARSRETGGTGLGLSITRNAILMHRGAIKIYSKENEGTTFTVRVPLNYIA